MKRKKYWRLVSGVLLLVLLTACGSGQRVNAEGGLMTQAPGLFSEAPGQPETSKGPSETKRVAEGEQDAEASTAAANGEEKVGMKMNVQIGSSVFTATLENNAAVDTLVAMMEEAPVTVRMSDYAGFEKVGPLGTSLPTSNSHTTTQAGDIVLYQGDQIVIFYGSNSWSYTRLGRIDDLTGWENALGSGNVSVTFSLGE